MTERIKAEDSLKFQLAKERVVRTSAQMQLAAFTHERAVEDANAEKARLFQEYGLIEADQVDLTTGTITRAPRLEAVKDAG